MAVTNTYTLTYPDKLVQAPDYSQSYNRYTYCFNNPLMLTDPSGWEGEPLGYYDNGTPFWTTTDAYYYYEVNKRGYANGSDGMRSGYDYGFGGGWDTYDVVSNSFGNESWNGSVAGNIMGAYYKQANNTYARYNYNNGWVTMVEQHPMSEIGLNWNGNNLEIWYAPNIGAGSSRLISSHYMAQGGWGETWYYGVEIDSKSDYGHAFAYNPNTNIVYEINHPNKGQTHGLESWLNGGPKSIGYKFDLTTESGSKTFWSFYNSRVSVWLSPVYVPNPQAATNFFESQVDQSFDYNFFNNNCKHFSIQGLRMGGADISNWNNVPRFYSGEFTQTWYNPY